MLGGGFVFVGPAHRCSSTLAELWRPPKRATLPTSWSPFPGHSHRLGGMHPLPGGPLCITHFMFEGRECPESSKVPRSTGRLLHRWCSLESTADVAPPHSPPRPPIMVLLESTSLLSPLPPHSFLPQSVPWWLRGAAPVLRTRALFQTEALKRKREARPDEREDLEIPQRGQKATGKGTRVWEHVALFIWQRVRNIRLSQQTLMYVVQGKAIAKD